MDDGSAIILSVAKYYSPEGKSIQDNGVTPEELVAEADTGAAEVDDDSEPAPQATPVPAEKKPAEDLILRKAIEIAQRKG
jgi:carboxyl-terminal processing protease